MAPRRLPPDSPELPAVLNLIRGAFAPMDSVVNPPSSVQLLTLDKLRQHAANDEVWVISTPPVGCMILSVQPDTLYLGKLAVAPAARKQGLARQLVDHALHRAQALHRPAVTLQTRIELTANHATFRRLGFTEAGRTRHPGFNRDTSITFTRAVTEDRLPGEGANQ